MMGKIHGQARGQRGAALMIGLVLLLVMTLMGIAAMRSTTMQERMAGSLQDQNRALQAAESALRGGEQALRGVAVPTFDGDGWYDILDDLARPTWDTDPTNTSANRAIEYTGDTALDESLDRPPQYYIERLVPVIAERGPGGSLSLGDGEALEEMDLYRVVARGFGRNSNTVVIVESIFRR
ncbi:type IV pilus assembly protein PilX [Isoalcanivorax pacificus W11-5]|uniref:Type IV pilus assembly protein PilX n=1 Tax=Isoalcanivorax pacificus W11-5 TaxID=391936 RepID=A0A0B4XK60_9GAMM|nr:PilX N-terminal domain-containing pilus assembly protein [Isoalcanivorax pacificus]AJD47070.1 type IV pilus assembly protein PilX [Isoalcanivorax pacificus W11-5]